MEKSRLDQAMVSLGLVSTRSQAESYIRLGKVKVDGRVVAKPGQMVSSNSKISLSQKQQYVSRAALKLESVAVSLGLDFKDKVVLDVGSSTGGFTDFALRGGARKVIAVDVGSQQLHHSLRTDERVELHEQTDIRSITSTSSPIDIVVIDVSFISLQSILPAIAKLVSKEARIVAMVKPQFEAGRQAVNRGVVKNDRLRRAILKDFEAWVNSLFVVLGKADSQVAGAKGNKERFYLLQKF